MQVQKYEKNYYYKKELYRSDEKMTKPSRLWKDYTKICPREQDQDKKPWRATKERKTLSTNSLAH